ncbi:MAG: aminomethyltransferase family protein [Alphaproteobacteria bacterium]|jgi:aminomethyltransferase|nr:aminomethyltransferase family protein [Alphaproteobacteria bacterium]
MAGRTSTLDATIRALGAKMAPWNDMDVAMALPGDMNAEHDAIREAVGMWDTSALTKIYVRGPDAEAAIDYLVTRDITKLYVGKSAYVPILQDNGHFCDDGFIFHLEEDVYLAVTSIGPTLELLQGWAKGRNVSVELNESLHMITLQGPNSAALLDSCTAMDIFSLRYCHQEKAALFGSERIISRTGYSGERGYEIFVPADGAVALWQQFMEQGKDYGLMPISFSGLEMVHIESGLMAYGAEATEENTPWEVDFGWAISRTKKDFRGREALFALEGKEKVKLRGLVAEHDSVVEHFAELRIGGEKLGFVTTPAYSKRLGQSLALVHIAPSAAEPGTRVELVGPTIQCPATVASIPFVDPKRQRMHAM